MYDKGKVFTFLAVFALLVLFPFLYGAAQGNDGMPPVMPLPSGETACIESKAYMRASHMEMLNQWRDEVVREDARTYRATNGKTYEKSLTLSCMRCHESEATFCGKCHSYVGVSTYCWSCHVDPKKE